MARDLDPSCRKCRREGIKLMLKGTRCETAKCPMEKQWRCTMPGMHGGPARKASPYGVRLREKQKVKRYYGVLERQFRRYFQMAQRFAGNTGEALLSILERRLDNVVCKAGFMPSRKAAREAIVHGHFTLNGRLVDRPGLLVRVGDKVAVKPRERSQKLVRPFLEARTTPPQAWLSVDAANLEAGVNALPGREDVQIPVEELLIVEIAGR